MESFLTGRVIRVEVGDKKGIPTFLLQQAIVKQWTAQEIKNYPCA